MTPFCPNCWQDLPERTAICPHCGCNVPAQVARADYADKLITGLHYPGQKAPIRAAWLLGERHERKAVGELCRIVLQSENTFIVESAVEALGKIGDQRALSSVRILANHSDPLVRAKAQLALKSLVAGDKAKEGAG